MKKTPIINNNATKMYNKFASEIQNENNINKIKSSVKKLVVQGNHYTVKEYIQN